MKKFFYLAMVFGLAACTIDNAEIVKDGNTEGVAEASYLTVNIVSAANVGTRAELPGGYESGDPTAESDIKTLLFYFFDENGDAAVVDFAQGNSFKLFNVPKDGFGEEENNKQGETVEKVHEATIIIQTKKVGDDYVGVPEKTLVVVNPPYTETKNLSLSEVREKVCTAGDFSKMVSTSTGFTMSNSVFATDDNKLVDAVSIKDKVQETEEKAKNAPVDIYVERVAAKLSVKTEMTSVEGKEGLYDTTVKYQTTTEGETKDNPIYIKLEGWNVTTTADQSYYLKSVNEEWVIAPSTNGLFKTRNEPWTIAGYHRSFWAVNPDDVHYRYGNYTGEKATDTSGDMVNANPTKKYKEWDGLTMVYLPENAGEGKALTHASTANPTKVIIAATLVDEDGAALHLAQYAGQLFVSEGPDYTKVKEAILSTIKFYKEVNGTEFVSVTPADVELKTAWEIGKASDKTEGRYLVYAVLTETAGNLTWYDAAPTEDEMAEEDWDLDEWKGDHEVKSEAGKTVAEKINTALAAAGGAKVWNSGATYYYFDVRHIANPVIDGKSSTDSGYDLEAAEKVPGYYGIVRNHVYKTTINSITGLGTPVFRPEEIIIPEKPADEFGYIAARINVLAWRIVNGNYDLNW